MSQWYRCDRSRRLLLSRNGKTRRRQTQQRSKRGAKSHRTQMWRQWLRLNLEGCGSLTLIVLDLQTRLSNKLERKFQTRSWCAAVQGVDITTSVRMLRRLRWATVKHRTRMVNYGAREL